MALSEDLIFTSRPIHLPLRFSSHTPSLHGWSPPNSNSNACDYDNYVRLSRHVNDLIYETFNEVYDLELFIQGIARALQKRSHPDDLNFPSCSLSDKRGKTIMFYDSMDYGMNNHHTTLHT